MTFVVGLQLFVLPEVVINGLNFSLECKANAISANINIENPSQNLVSCRPTSVLLNASCTDPAYSIDEESKTVSMTKEATNLDQGKWECIHTTSTQESASTNITVERK